MLNQDFESIKQQFLQMANSNPLVDSLYLYGSHAKGNANKNSDIDLAVIFSQPEEDILEHRLRPELLALEWVSTLKLKENSLSILDLELAPIPLAMAVLKTGKMLLNKNPSHEFEVTGRIMSKWEIDYLHHYQNFG
jgi:predicted nucleotidyltransferase